MKRSHLLWPSEMASENVAPHINLCDIILSLVAKLRQTFDSGFIHSAMHEVIIMSDPKKNMRVSTSGNHAKTTETRILLNTKRKRQTTNY